MTTGSDDETESYTAWARIESSDISPLGESEADDYIVGAFLGEQSPESLIPLGDALDADPEVLRSTAQALARLPVARFAIDRTALRRTLGEGLSDIQLANRWLKLDLQASPGEAATNPEVQSPDLSGSLRLVGAVLVTLETLNAYIKAVFKAAETTPAEIGQLISEALPSGGGRSLPYASVIDVGQGGMVAVHHRDNAGQPSLFFDFGWPTRWYEKTAPVPPDLQLAPRTPVILTHWDFDHYAFALDDVKSNTYELRKGADDRIWLVPGVGGHWADVYPSATGIILALQLFLADRLKVWPHELPGITEGFVTVARSVPYVPSPEDANQNGLFMMLHKKLTDGQRAKLPRSASIPAILIPGDADYEAIKHALDPAALPGAPFPNIPFAWRGLVATHHGGKFNGTVLPTAVASHARIAPKGVLAISAGQVKRYGHPKAEAQVAYISVGNWRQHTITFNRRTINRDYCSLACCHCNCCIWRAEHRGNIELNLDDSREQHICRLDWRPFQ